MVAQSFVGVLAGGGSDRSGTPDTTHRRGSGRPTQAPGLRSGLDAKRPFPELWSRRARNRGLREPYSRPGPDVSQRPRGLRLGAMGVQVESAEREAQGAPCLLRSGGNKC